MMNKKKIIIITIFLAVVAISLFWSINSFFYVPAGWRLIEPSKGINNASQLSFEYLFKNKVSSRYELQISDLYTDTLNYSYKIFNCQESDEKGIYYINTNPNKKIQIDENLYKVLSIINQYNDRSIFLGPIYSEYNNLFLCDNDGDASRYDPEKNTIISDYFNSLLPFINNPEDISMQLYEDNYIELIISDNYMDFAKQNDIHNFIDLFWYENACTLDYLDSVLKDNAYDNYALSSIDGFVINNNKSNSINLLLKEDNIIDNIYTLSLGNSFNAVSFYSYPVLIQDYDRYYEYDDGRIVNPYLDITSGLCNTNINNLIVYDGKLSLLELTLKARKAYIDEPFNEELINDIFYIYNVDKNIVRNDKSANAYFIKEGYKEEIR